MGYRRLLLTRWSRRDWLAVGLVALTAVFLAGASLTLVSAGQTIEQRTASFDASPTATYHETPTAVAPEHESRRPDASDRSSRQRNEAGVPAVQHHRPTEIQHHDGHGKRHGEPFGLAGVVDGLAFPVHARHSGSVGRDCPDLPRTEHGGGRL